MAGRSTRIGACAVVAAALTMGWLQVAHAGAPPSAPPLTVSPTTVSNGTPFTVSGAGCIDPDTQSSEELTVYVVAPKLYHAYDGDYSGTLYVKVDVADDGTWSVTTAPNTREEYYGPFDDYDTTVTAVCTRTADPPDILFRYEEVAMRYLGADVEPTSTTTSPTSTSTAPPASAPAGPVEPAPAVPLPGDASFTG